MPKEIPHFLKNIESLVWNMLFLPDIERQIQRIKSKSSKSNGSMQKKPEILTTPINYC